MFKVLLKKQLYQLNQSFFYDSKKGKLRSKASSIGFIAFFVVLMVGVLGSMFAYFSAMICKPLFSAGLGWLYFTLISLVSIMMGVFGSVFNTYSSLYQAKDNNLLLSLPIPVRYLLASRLLGVYLMGTMYSIVVILPAVIVRLVVAGFSAKALFGSLVLMAAITVIVLVLSCALGLVVAKVSVRLKNKSLVTTVLSLGFLALYYYVYANAYTLLQTVIQNAQTIGEKIKGAAYPLYIFGKVGEGEPLALLITVLCVAALFVLTYILMERSFLKIATSSAKTVRREYREKQTKLKSADSALLSKELSRLLSSPTYMLNCALGVVFLVVGGIALLFKGEWLVDLLIREMGFGKDFAIVIGTLVVCMLTTMNDLTAPSISLEGKSIWLSQSLPVSAWQVLRSKFNMHMLLTGIPSLFCSVCVCIVLRPSAAVCAAVLIFPLLFAALFAVLGLVLNLKIPNLNWTSETVAVKQSASVFIILFAGLILSFIFAAVYYLLFMPVGALWYLVIASAVVTVLCALCVLWLKKRGTEIYKNL